MTHIGLFSVPTGEDDDFLAAWASDGAPGATLYRALRDDAEFRFAEIAEDGGAYAVVRTEGPAGAEAGCLLINPFEVREDEDERFLAAWEEARAALDGARGYLGSRLHHAPEADYRFVDVTRWSSPLMAFRARATAGALPHPSHPTLYQPVA